MSKKAILDVYGNVAKGNLNSRTTTKLARGWIDLHCLDLEAAWEAAKNYQEIKKIDPLV